MRYISEKVMAPNGLFRSRDGEPLGPVDDVILRPSDLLGTVKRTLERRRHRAAANSSKAGSNGNSSGLSSGVGVGGVRRSSSRCQCKHHQQRQLKQRQEEQRRALKRQLAEKAAVGESASHIRRHLDAINRHTGQWTAVGDAAGSPPGAARMPPLPPAGRRFSWRRSIAVCPELAKLWLIRRRKGAGRGRQEKCCGTSYMRYRRSYSAFYLNSKKGS